MCVLTGRDPNTVTYVNHCSTVCPEERYLTLAVFLYTLVKLYWKGVECSENFNGEKRRYKVTGRFAKYQGSIRYARLVSAV